LAGQARPAPPQGPPPPCNLQRAMCKGGGGRVNLFPKALGLPPGPPAPPGTRGGAEAQAEGCEGLGGRLPAD
jgi:hypothetical protein